MRICRYTYMRICAYKYTRMLQCTSPSECSLTSMPHCNSPSERTLTYMLRCNMASECLLTYCGAAYWLVSTYQHGNTPARQSGILAHIMPLQESCQGGRRQIMQATRTAQAGTLGKRQGVGQGKCGNGRKAPTRARESQTGVACCTATSAPRQPSQKVPQKNQSSSSI